MKKYALLNNLTGWFTFLVAAVTYILTLEPTASFWDCGEFITSAFKLEVGHPPGAPFFMLLGRFFSLFAFGDVTQVAYMINLLSGMASAFTILFLFWTITHIAKKVVVKDKNEPDSMQTFLIMAAGLLGALTYTFSDSFWFSAVEGEVYALSSFFTAIVFWAILKWESAADKPYSERWIIFIAYMMGLSIGVHLLNLLAIPAIVYIYYFKRYKVSLQGVIYTGLISLVLLVVVQYGIIPGVPSLASSFELMFTNSFGMPYYTGTTVYLLLLVGLVVFGIWYSHKKGKVILNLITVSFAVILIGYSSFALIIIRANAKTPMNQNNPDNPFDLLSYLNREQYGDRPLVYGQYFNSPVTGYNETKPVYMQKDEKYVVIDHNIERIYDAQWMTIFPRMYSDQESPPHIRGYMEWLGTSEGEFFNTKIGQDNQPVVDQFGQTQYDHSNPKDKPSFGQNLQFFMSYQFMHMYMRYFMWNFAGRQNDIQGQGEIVFGNWISGISFLDNLRLGTQDKMPHESKNNAGRNTYYFLPLLLGLLGMYYLYQKSKQSFWVVMLLFFMTGIAIIVYLNQPPYQPRERDYAFSGSFYAFSIFIGFGVLLLFELVKKYIPARIALATVTAVSILASPVILAAENWDDHDRSGRYTARDFAYNYLNSCAPNAILFTNGDNDTFPLWYAQEVEGIRRDVRVINLSYLNTDWYIDQMKQKAYESEPVPFNLTKDQYLRGQREFLYINEQPNLFINEKFKNNKSKYVAAYDSLYSVMLQNVSGSKFPELAASDWSKLNTSKDNFGPEQLYMFLNRLSQKTNADKFGYNAENLTKVKDATAKLISRISTEPLSLKTAMSFLVDTARYAKISLQDGNLHNFMPSRKLTIPVDRKKLVDNGTVAEKDADKISPITWTLRQSMLRKNDLMVLDLLATNNWERPIYFATTVGPDNYLQLDAYFQLEGLAYRVVPIRPENNRGTGRVNTDILYDNLMNKFRLDNMKDKNVYWDENNLRMFMNLRSGFSRLAEALVAEGKNDKAIEVLDKCEEYLPNETVPYNYFNIKICELYYQVGQKEKGAQILKTLASNINTDMDYYLSLSERLSNKVGEEKERAMAMASEIMRVAGTLNDEQLKTEIESMFTQTMQKANIQ